MSCRNTTRIRPSVMEQIIELIRQVRFGEIVITVHDSRIVQVEKREKTRFQD